MTRIRPKKGAHLFYDADYLIYLSAFASERAEYVVRDRFFKYKRDAAAYCLENGISKDEILFESEILSFKNTEHIVKAVVKNLKKRLKSNLITSYLSPSTTFRNRLYPDYKGHRPAKPFYYTEAKELVAKELGVLGLDQTKYEADDLVAMAHYEVYKEDPTRSIIISNDKDLNTTPGFHYNPNKKELYYVTEEEAEYFFYYQLLVGDAVDNIPGISGIGDKRARLILDNCTNYYSTVRDQYEQKLGDEGEYLMHLYADLLWIVREEGVTWKDGLKVSK